MRYFDLLSINHFTLWFLLGFFTGNSKYGILIVLTLSILWEISEIIASKVPAFRSFLKKHWIIPEKYWNEPAENKATDLLLNLLGYTLAANLKVRDPKLAVVALIAFIASTVAASQSR